MSLGKSDKTGAGPGDRPGPQDRPCRLAGLNQNYTSRSGTLYHIQVEDRGPVTDRLTGRPVRRINVVVYANYGDPGARIVHGRDHDYPDVRTAENDELIAREVQERAAAARLLIEERERRQIDGIKRQIREYHATRSEALKREFERTNAAYPFVFSRAWRELRAERPEGSAYPAEEPAASFSEIVYPLDSERRDLVLEIERLVLVMGRDLARLRAAGHADGSAAVDGANAVAEARRTLSGADRADLDAARLVLLRDRLLAAWRRLQAPLSP